MKRKLIFTLVHLLLFVGFARGESNFISKISVGNIPITTPRVGKTLYSLPNGNTFGNEEGWKVTGLEWLVDDAPETGEVAYSTIYKAILTIDKLTGREFYDPENDTYDDGNGKIDGWQWNFQEKTLTKVFSATEVRVSDVIKFTEEKLGIPYVGDILAIDKLKGGYFVTGDTVNYKLDGSQGRAKWYIKNDDASNNLEELEDGHKVQAGEELVLEFNIQVSNTDKHSFYDLSTLIIANEGWDAVDLKFEPVTNEESADFYKKAVITLTFPAAIDNTGEIVTYGELSDIELPVPHAGFSPVYGLEGKDANDNEFDVQVRWFTKNEENEPQFLDEEEDAIVFSPKTNYFAELILTPLPNHNWSFESEEEITVKINNESESATKEVSNGITRIVVKEISFPSTETTIIDTIIAINNFTAPIAGADIPESINIEAVPNNDQWTIQEGSGEWFEANASEPIEVNSGYKFKPNTQYHYSFTIKAAEGYTLYSEEPLKFTADDYKVDTIKYEENDPFDNTGVVEITFQRTNKIPTRQTIIDIKHLEADLSFQEVAYPSDTISEADYIASLKWFVGDIDGNDRLELKAADSLEDGKRYTVYAKLHLLNDTVDFGDLSNFKITANSQAKARLSNELRHWEAVKDSFGGEFINGDTIIAFVLMCGEKQMLENPVRISLNIPHAGTIINKTDNKYYWDFTEDVDNNPALSIDSIGNGFDFIDRLKVDSVVDIAENYELQNASTSKNIAVVRVSIHPEKTDSFYLPTSVLTNFKIENYPFAEVVEIVEKDVNGQWADLAIKFTSEKTVDSKLPKVLSPKVGGNPISTLEAKDGSLLADVKWESQETGKDWQNFSGAKFKENELYRATLTNVKPAPGYTFIKEVKNDGSHDLISKDYFADATFFNGKDSIIIEFAALKPHVTETALTGNLAAIAGNSPTGAITSTSTQWTIKTGTAGWDLPQGEKFAANQEYHYSFAIEANGNYTLDGLNSNSFTYDGDAANVTYDTETYKITITFRTTATDISNPHVSTLNVTSDRGVLTISGLQGGDVVKVYDLQGRLLYRQVVNTNIVDVYGLDKGMYVVAVGQRKVKVVNK